MQKPKILFVSNLFPDVAEPYRGLDNATLLHRLSGEFEIRVVSPRPFSLPSVFSGRQFQCRNEDSLFSPVYVQSPYIPKIGSRFNHLLMARVLEPVLAAVRKEFPFEAVLCSWVYPDGCAISQVARNLRFPYAVIAQGSDVHSYLKIPARRKIIAASMASAGVIITRSAELGRLLGEAGVAQEKLQTVYNGINFSIFKPGDRAAAREVLGLPAAGKIILFVGNFLPVKNPLLLVSAHEEYCRRNPSGECSLLLVGGGPMETEIRAVAGRLTSGKRILFAGRLEPDSVARAMQAADLLCLPSENEGVPNVILESFATGLRVVASRVGGIPEVLNHDFLGRLTARGSLTELVAAFEELFSLPARPDAITEHARQFSWERTVSGYSTLLRDMMGQPDTRS